MNLFHRLATLVSFSCMACSSSDDDAEVRGTYEDKCDAACKPVESCSSEDPAPCVSDCVAATEGLEITCAQCIVENTHWQGSFCDGESTCSIGSDCTFIGEACTEEDEICNGHTIGKASGGACKSACGA